MGSPDRFGDEDGDDGGEDHGPPDDGEGSGDTREVDFFEPRSKLDVRLKFSPEFKKPWAIDVIRKPVRIDLLGERVRVPVFIDKNTPRGGRQR